MAIRLSSGLQRHLLATGPLSTALAFGVIHIYSGPQPASADAAPTGTLLGRITDGGGPFTHGSPTNGLLLDLAPQVNSLVKAFSQTWVLHPLTVGNAGWWRFKANPFDADDESLSALRMDGTVSQPYSELFLPSTSLVPGQDQTLGMFQITFKTEN